MISRNKQTILTLASALIEEVPNGKHIRLGHEIKVDKAGKSSISYWISAEEYVSDEEKEA